MNDIRFYHDIGSNNGMDVSQNDNLVKVLSAQYDPTDDFKAKAFEVKAGPEQMLKYFNQDDLGKNYIMGKTLSHETYRDRFSTPERTYLFLDEATRGDKPLMKPSKTQLDKASAVLASFDNDEKMRQVQSALGVEVDGEIGDDTKRAAANYLTVFSEKEFKKQVKGALGATRNFEPILAYFKQNETGDTVYKDGELHVGSETKNSYNKGGVANTTQYGVVEKDYKNASGKTVKGFPRLKGESDKDHALRFYKQDILPRIEKIKGIQDEPQEVVTALAHLVWNRGNLPAKLDLTSAENSQKVLLGVTTTGRKHSAGVINASIRGYDAIADIKGWPKVAEVRTLPSTRTGQSFVVEMTDAQGNVMFKGSKDTAAKNAPDSDIRANRTYQVVNGEIKTGDYQIASIK